MRMIDEGQRTVGELLRWSAALLTAAAAAIHFAVTPEHFDEDWVFGVFFVVSAWSQLLWALLVTRSDDRRLLMAGAVGNAAIALVWAASRTTGLPVGPEPGAAEAVGLVDVLATIWELLAAAAIVLVPRIHRRSLSQTRVAAFIVALAIVVIPLTSGAIASNTGHAPMRQDKERTHEQNTHS